MSYDLLYYDMLLRFTRRLAKELKGSKKIYMKNNTTIWESLMRYIILGQTFLDASLHLYESVCPSVRPSVRRSVGMSRFCKKCSKKLHQPNSIIAFQCNMPFYAFLMPLGHIIGRWVLFLDIKVVWEGFRGGL